jgi:hypothetical protein
VARAALAPHGADASDIESSLVRVKNTGRVDSDVRAFVTAAARRLDDRYLDLYDEDKPEGRSEGWQAAYRLARAAAAAPFALDPDPTVAAVEASYEAWHSLDEDSRLRSVVKDVT